MNLRSAAFFDEGVASALALLLALQQVTVHLEGVPFDDAAERVLVRFGMKPEWVRSSFQPMSLVHLRLENACFCQAADSLCDAAGVARIRTPRHSLVERGFCGVGPEYERIITKDFGPVRITAVLGTDHAPPGPVNVRLYFLFPPGRPPSRLELRGFGIHDSLGKVLPASARGPVQRSTSDSSRIAYDIRPKLTIPWNEVQPPLTLTGVLVPTYGDGTSATLPFELNAAPDWKGPSEKPKWPLWMAGGSLVLLIAACVGLLFLLPSLGSR